MAVYNEILTWVANKPDFVKDALRRIIMSPSLKTTDIDDLSDLIKKEAGFQGITKNPTPINSSHIPTQVNSITNIAKLLSIEKPVNINALYNKTKLEFDPNGLTVIYGNNGSGKSGYSKILKKVCWSRHQNVELKKNVHTNDTTPQSVTLNYSVGTNNHSYLWNIGQTANKDLNTIFVFDTDCANIYLNTENVTEYRPVGIDLLDRLILVFRELESKLNQEKKGHNTLKPNLESNKFFASQIFNWYQRVEKVDALEIQRKLRFTQADSDRKSFLIGLLKSVNPEQQKIDLEQKKSRFEFSVSEFEKGLKLFSDAALQRLTEIKTDFISKSNAYIIAQGNIKDEYHLNGVGSDSWRILWNAAREFAVKEVHPNHNHFPSDISAEFCVLCQQSLNIDASERLRKFNLFINDNTSDAFDKASKSLHQTIEVIKNYSIPDIQVKDELDIILPGFKQKFSDFLENFQKNRDKLLGYLAAENREALNSLIQIEDLAIPIREQIKVIESKLEDLNKLLTSRAELEKELLELEGLEILTANKTQILTYCNEHITKHYLDKCLSYLNTSSISKKIGDILESSAIVMQGQEFLSHLKKLNPDLAAKVTLSKTRTTAGKTYQRIAFSSSSESLTSVLSEGEQKVIALANFLSECTIDARINSIVFDDPVTSLDQDYREAIASILVDLASKRQVIVLTHDLYFLRLLLELHNEQSGNDCKITGLVRNKNISGYNSDEIPYLAKNCQQRIDTIRGIINQIKGFSPTNQTQIDYLLDSGRKKFRMLIEKAVEELLANKSIERFSRNIHVKSGNLSGFVVVDHADIQFLLTLFGKYSITEHDGSVATLPQLPDEIVIDSDLKGFENWRSAFNAKLKAFKTFNGYK